MQKQLLYVQVKKKLLANVPQLAHNMYFITHHVIKSSVFQVLVIFVEKK